MLIREVDKRLHRMDYGAGSREAADGDLDRDDLVDWRVLLRSSTLWIERLVASEERLGVQTEG